MSVCSGGPFYNTAMTAVTGNCGTWQLDTTSGSSINQTGVPCGEKRKPLCLRPIDPSQGIEEIHQEPAPVKRKKRRRGKRKKPTVNKKLHSLRWKQRKNKKSEKIGFIKKRQDRSNNLGRQAGCDPVEVCDIRLE